MNKVLLVIVSVAVLVVVGWGGGCGVSTWERSFEPGGDGRIVFGQRGSAEQVANVRMQRVPWERMEAAIRERDDALIRSDRPIDQWSDAQRAAVDAAVLRHLLVADQGGGGAGTTILGWSRFTTTDFSKPPFQEMAEFATRLDATRVAWASRPAGKMDKVTREIVFLDHWEQGCEYDPRTGRYRRSVFPERTTASVPVVVQADATEFVAFWLRQ